MLVLVAVAAGALVAPAGAAPDIRGTWVGKTRLHTKSQGVVTVRVRYVITALTPGQAAGTTRYRGAGRTCHGALTLRARVSGGYAFRDRVTSGRRCTSGDRIFARAAGSALRVRLTERGGAVFRFTMRRP
jgi:hypothetical protein